MRVVHSHHTTPLFVCLSFLVWGTTVSAQERMLTADAESGFRKVVQAVESGAAGTDIREANVSVQKTAARIELVLADGQRETFLLHAAGRGGELQSRYFALSREGGASLSHARALQQLLDSSFPADPFTAAPQAGGAGFAVRDAPPVADAWRNDGLRGVVPALVKASLRPVSRPVAGAMIVLNLLGLIACLALIWSGDKAPDVKE